MLPMSRSLTLFCDGASRGNPGPGSYGFVIYENGILISKEGRALGSVTNNVAEYAGLIQGLVKCIALEATQLTVKSDSQVLVRQLNGQYKVKAPHLQELVREAKELLKNFNSVQILHIPREENKEADRVANAALDGTL